MRARAMAVGVSLAIVAGGVGPSAAAMAADPPRQAPVQQQAVGSSPATVAAKGPRVRVTPAEGRSLRRHPVPVTVKSPKRSYVLSAKLNGRKVTEDLELRRPGVRRMTASASHGLRFGRNTLRVTILSHKGTRTVTRHFRVVHHRPLTGAGRDRVVAASSTSRLRGKVRLHPSAGKGATRVRWEVVRAPRGSQARRSVSGATAALALARPATLTPVLRTDVPGRYVLKMTATQSGRTSSDTVTYAAAPGPQIAVDTMVAGGPPAIRLGQQVYTSPAPKNGDGWTGAWQVLVVNRATLELVWNRTYYPCIQDPSKTCYRDSASQQEAIGVDLARDLTNLPSTDLVLVSTQPQMYGSMTMTLDDLAPIGAPKAPSGWKPSPGNTSVIGVPGRARGSAEYKLTTTGTANIQGFLEPDVHSNYAFVPNQRVTFDTRATSTCSTGECEVSAGFAPTNGGPAIDSAEADFSKASGYLVGVYDGQTMALRERDQFLTNSPKATAEVQRMTAFLGYHVGPGDVVVVTSVLTPGVTPGTISRSVDGASLAALAEQIARTGGTRNTFNQAAGGDDDYTLLGWGDAAEDSGVETRGQGARVRGALTPDNTSHFKPVNTSRQGQPSETLSELLAKTPDPSAWPMATSPAIAYIGQHTTPILGSDPRSAYWSQSNDWDAVSNSLQFITYAKARNDGQTFSEKEFNDAKQQLSQEFVWLANVDQMIKNLKAPLTTNLATVWSQVQATAYDELRAPSGAVDVNPFYILEMIVGVIASFVIPEALPYFAMAGALLQGAGMAFDKMDDGSAAADQELRIQANKLGITLQQQLLDSLDSLDTMGQIIKADFAKLQEVGTYANCNGSPPGCPAGYYFPSQAQKDLTDAGQRAVKLSIYSKLMPVNFPAFIMGPSDHAGPNDWGCQTVGNIFADVPEAGKGALWEVYSPNDSRDSFRAFAIADVKDRWHVYHLPKTTLQEIFSPVTDGPNNLGGDLYRYARDNNNDWPDHAFDCGWGEGD